MARRRRQTKAPRQQRGGARPRTPRQERELKALSYWFNPWDKQPDYTQKGGFFLPRPRTQKERKQRRDIARAVFRSHDRTRRRGQRGGFYPYKMLKKTLKASYGPRPSKSKKKKQRSRTKK